jgi:hypothetical protein
LNRPNLGDIPLLSNIGENISATVRNKELDYQQKRHWVAIRFRLLDKGCCFIVLCGFVF